MPPKKPAGSSTPSTEDMDIDLPDHNDVVTGSTVKSTNQAKKSKAPTTPRKNAKADGGKGEEIGTPSKSKWTTDEKSILFDSIMKKYTMTLRDFDDVAKELDRPATQCYDQWRKSMLKKVQKAIADGAI